MTTTQQLTSHRREHLEARRRALSLLIEALRGEGRPVARATLERGVAETHDLPLNLVKTALWELIADRDAFITPEGLVSAR